MKTSRYDTLPTRHKKRHNTLSSLIAGVGSGAASSIACAPLDLVRTRMQVMGDLTQQQPLVSPDGVKRPLGAAAAAVSRTPKGTAAAAVSDCNQMNVFRTLRDVFTKDGVRGCFRGLGMTLLTVPTFWGLYFPLYETFKSDLFHRYNAYKTTSSSSSSPSSSSSSIQIHDDSQRMPATVHMASAILAGAVADFFCNPMFVVRTRMQTEALHVVPGSSGVTGIAGTVRGLYRENGGRIGIFWRGYGASLLGLSHVAIQFPLYEWMKAEARQKSEEGQESPLEILLASAASKMVATSLTYPHEVIRSRMMDFRRAATTTGANGAVAAAAVQPDGILSTLRRVTVNEGYAALYTGVHVSLIRVVPNCCVTFMTYEMLLRWAKRNDGLLDVMGP